MRHATDEDLARLDDLLVRLRAIDGLVETKPGKFQRRSKAFIHFHEDAGDLYADIRHPDGWERRRVSSAAEQKALVTEARELLSSPR